jgi:hypothetical protein
MPAIQELVTQCLAERHAFRSKGERHSPACIQLLRRAFARDELAWEAVCTQVFKEDVRRFIHAATSVSAQAGFAFTPEDREDAVQETWLAFRRSAVKRPQLLQGDELGPVMKYLQDCAKSGVGMVKRRFPPRPEAALGELAGEDDGEAPAGALPLQRHTQARPARSLIDERQRLSELIREIDKIIETEEERIVAQERFLNGSMPREMVKDYPHLFPGDTDQARIKYVNNVVDRLLARIRKLPAFQVEFRSARRKSGDAAFLQFSMLDDSELDEAKMPIDEPCPYDNATLLDYIRNEAPPALRTAIERSPACVEAAAILAEDIERLTPLIRMVLCPDVETLIDYQARRLPGAQQLVVHRHVQNCRPCQVEIAMFDAVDAVSLQDEPSLVRRIYESLFLPPTLSGVPVRGALPSIHYRTQIRTPAIDIFIFTQKSSGKARTWTLRGELRSEDGLQFIQVEKIILHAVNPVAATEAVEVTTTLDEDGMFVLRGLETGVYSLQIFTNEEEVLVRALKVGDDS